MVFACFYPLVYANIRRWRWWLKLHHRLRGHSEMRLLKQLQSNLKWQGGHQAVLPCPVWTQCLQTFHVRHYQFAKCVSITLYHIFPLWIQQLLHLSQTLFPNSFFLVFYYSQNEHLHFKRWMEKHLMASSPKYIYRYQQNKSQNQNISMFWGNSLSK